MSCYYPLPAWWAKTVNRKTGKRGITFSASDALLDRPLSVPCGKCVGCRLERARQWTVRCMHEASLYDRNCFVTLTYSPDYIPEDSSLVKKDVQLFMKRLRKKYGQGIRYLCCGEYGASFTRPHYHLLLFNFDFPDKKFHHTSTSGERLYESESLNEVWKKGICIIGDVTLASCAYVARYVTKKVTGEDSDLHYVNIMTGVIREKEFITMSRRPGIASHWFQKFSGDLYPLDSAVVDGQELKVPRFYDKCLEKVNPKLYKRVKLGRDKKISKYCLTEENSSRRLDAKAKFMNLVLKNKKRSYENG